MSIIIKNSYNKISSERKQYGKLIVETSIRPDKNSTIQAGKNQHTYKNNDGSANNKQARNSTSQITYKQNTNEQLNANRNVTKTNLVDVMKSIKLRKGQKLSLNQNCKNISKLLLTLDYKTILNGNNEFDIDASIFMVDINDKTAEKDFIFYENAKSTCGGVSIKEDHNTYLKEAYDECIQLDLNLIPPRIQKLAFTVTIYEANERHQNFAQLSEGYFRIIAVDTKQEILSYNFNENLSKETAIVVAELYRYKNEWKINCIGSGFSGGLEAMCNNYGIETI